MRVVIYEDNPGCFYPLINLYPQFNLRIGMKTIAEHIAHYFPNTRIEYIGRDAFRFSKIGLKQPAVYISSRSLITQKIVLPKKDVKFSIAGEIVGFVRYTPPFPKNLEEINDILKTIKKTQKVSGFVLENVWDLIKYHEPLLRKHFTMQKGIGRLRKKFSVIGDRKDIFVAKNAEVHNLVCIDTSNGPVYIDKGAVIRPFTTIVGPSYIGCDTIIDRAKITNSSVGPLCRIGGEIEACIFQGYTNKYHEGFIGHSFIGEWVNLGALTTNSDLKNNYGPVRITIGKKKLDSGMIKLGCFIGDHTKFGIGTLIPTGAVVGCFVNFFNGGMIPHYVPSFTWLTAEKKEAYRVNKAIQTAKIVMKRRNQKLSKRYEHMIRMSYKWRNLS